MSKKTKSEELEQLAREVVDMNYNDWAKGDDYASLEKRYSEQGRKAMDDTIGKVAARTGGLASSYAAAAGNQAYGDYMSRLEDAARSLYDSQRENAIENYGIATDIYNHQQKEQQEAQAVAQDEIIASLMLGKTPSKDLIAESGRSAEYWDAQRAAMNQKEGISDPENIAAWETRIMAATPSTIETYINMLYEKDPALAFTLLTQWANDTTATDSEERQAKFNEMINSTK